MIRYIIAALGLIALLLTLAGLKASQISMLIDAGEQMKKAGPPPEVVSTRVAEQENWEGTLNAVASLESAKGVNLSNDAAGIVSRIRFESGATVHAGQVLVELDSSVERAQLGSTRARLELAEVSLKRSKALVEAGVGTQSQLDSDESALKSLRAEVEALEAQIGRKTIRAPFSGKLGIRTVNLGQYLAPGTPIASLESIDSIFADFTVPQHSLSALKVGMKLRADVGGRIVDGTISAIEPALNAATRAVTVRASLPNADGALRPGMFVRVSVILLDTKQVIAVPATSVVHASYGDSVFIVEDAAGGTSSGKVVRQQFVRLGAMRGDFVAIDEGVAAGQEVVMAGAFKLRNGVPVRIDNDSVKLDPKLEPHPENR